LVLSSNNLGKRTFVPDFRGSLRQRIVIMQRYLWCGVVGLALGFTGCSNKEEASTPTTTTSTATNTTPATPDAVMTEFLNAVKTGNKSKSELLLTEAARQKTTSEGIPFDPSGNPTMEFQIQGIQELAMPNNVSGAHVATTISFKDESGEVDKNDYIWVMRLESKGWRIAGLITKVFGDTPVPLDFEDPADMKARTQWIVEEAERRSKAAQPGAPAAPMGTVVNTPATTPGTSPVAQPNLAVPATVPQQAAQPQPGLLPPK
jgi:hypothetical protein